VADSRGGRGASRRRIVSSPRSIEIEEHCPTRASWQRKRVNGRTMEEGWGRGWSSGGGGASSEGGERQGGC
jgi:hypothetical protein